MSNQSTRDKLIQIRMSAMATAFELQLADPKMRDVPFEDRFAMLVEAEYNSRKSNRLKRLIRSAGFSQPNACIADINYNSNRNISKNSIHRLAGCEFITENRNIFITGATGCGKSYLACAIGLEACKQFYKTKYVRLPDLLIDLSMSHADNTFTKVLAKYASPKLLIIDEWLLLDPTEEQSRDLFEVINIRSGISSTIFCSQYLKEEWYERLGGKESPLAEAILDRIYYSSYEVNILPVDKENDKSMREVYGLTYEQRMLK